MSNEIFLLATTIVTIENLSFRQFFYNFIIVEIVIKWLFFHCVLDFLQHVFLALNACWIRWLLNHLLNSHIFFAMLFYKRCFSMQPDLVNLKRSYSAISNGPGLTFLKEFSNVIVDSFLVDGFLKVTFGLYLVPTLEKKWGFTHVLIQIVFDEILTTWSRYGEQQNSSIHSV